MLDGWDPAVVLLIKTLGWLALTGVILAVVYRVVRAAVRDGITAAIDADRLRSRRGHESG
ncbi:hypothetical protein ACTOB_002441 [Actinoplanes oblitus]|uniref:Uncharacterized protein n=1 Tax=Actinoplanes oblitus TaxID=3040509 RepID=A0ABY8WLS8_9ACTN|nr:hypothetical protein [Actinoplanes oblitus]WIM98824.1 hypothetical protein ACTOB_002441 [Actinoplanes oblitus]